MKSSLKNDNRGAALVAVIMAMLVLTLLGAAALTMTTSNLKNGIKERDFQSSYYIAEAGVNYGVEYFKQQIFQLYNEAIDSVEFFNSINDELVQDKIFTTKSDSVDLNTKKIDLELVAQYGNEPEVRLSLEDITGSELPTGPRTYRVVSKGILGDISRTVVKEFAVNWVIGESDSIVLNYAVYAGNNINIDHQHVTINGPIAAQNQIIFNEGNENGNFGKVNGDFASGNGVVPNVAKSKINGYETEFVPRTYNSPNFQDYDFPTKNILIADNTLELMESTNYVTNGPMGHGKNVLVQFSELENKNTLVLDGTDFSKINSFILTGDGVLDVIVRVSTKEEVEKVANSIKDRFSETDNDRYKVSIYYRSDEKLELKFNKSRPINASLLIKGSSNDKVVLTTKQLTINGNLIVGSGKVHIEGGNEDIFNGMFYAPNSDITVKNHAEFNGPIVAYNITFNNKSDVNYETNNDDYQVPTTPQKTSDITVLIPDDDISPVREK